MDSKGGIIFLSILYNSWHIYSNNIYPYRYKLEKIKSLFLLDNAFHASQHIT